MNVEFQTAGASTINQYADPVIDTSVKDAVQHISIPLAGMQPFDPTATSWNLSFNLYPGYAWEYDTAGNQDAVAFNYPIYYLDNITWVGANNVREPASLALLGLGGLLLVAMRRRK